MKLLTFLFALLSFSLALPNIDWSQIKPKYAYLEPLPNVTSHPNGRIIGGTEVPRNSIPYQVAVIIDDSTLCGGAIISESFVLTAAHCTYSAAYVHVIFGAHNILEPETTQIMLSSRSLINHYGYSPNSINNNIALIRLPHIITFSNNIQPVALPPVSADDYSGQLGILTGWGKVSDSFNNISPVLREVSLDILSNSVCSQTYGNSITPYILCTSGAGTVGACNGDSGGPLVVDGVQVGISSFVSPRGCESGNPTGYTRVSEFRYWIEEHTGL